MPSYFRQVPNFEYVSRKADSKNISEYSPVKNLFRRGKLKEDIFNDLTLFTKYQIIGDERPDNVAFKVYGDSTLDWLVLLSNNIMNIQTEWPLDHQSFHNFLLNKYGSEEQILAVHHYETTEVKNTNQVTIVPEGIEVPQNYSVEFYDARLESYTTVSNITTEITNKDYELKIENNKRNIYLLKAEYINLILNDMNQTMTYKEGSTQYVSETLVKGENIRLYS
tara:strand:- start:1 stop:669 length:669 start_codon:yes stop_codon:yes gene_type:complete